MAHDLNIHSCLEYFLEYCPFADMTDEQLEKLAPWNENVRKAYGKQRPEGKSGDVSGLLSSW